MNMKEEQVKEEREKEKQVKEEQIKKERTEAVRCARMTETSSDFCLEFNERNEITAIRSPLDPYRMNWAGGSSGRAAGSHKILEDDGTAGKSKAVGNGETAEKSKMTGSNGVAEKHWGSVICRDGVSVHISRKFLRHGAEKAGFETMPENGGRMRGRLPDSLVETYTFRNETDFVIYTRETELGICVTFPDYYTEAAVCMTQCCNTHIWCGGSSSYIMALRMGGEAPHLGLVLREGSLQGYSVERISSTEGREEELSNHRGVFILHPEPICIGPGESFTLSWELFWFDGKEDFRRRLLAVPGFVSIASESFLLTGRRPIEFTAAVCCDGEERPVILREGKVVPYRWKRRELEELAICMKKGEPEESMEGVKAEEPEEAARMWHGGSAWNAVVRESPEHTGEYNYEIIWKGRRSRTSFLVMPDIWELAGKRCRFIAEHQQCVAEGSYLKGAYLIYDNETHRQFYDHRNDYNGGRERVGMGVLMAHYLQRYPDAELRKSLERYLEYVLRELFDEETGEVFNDAPRCRDYIRLYNYPWMSRFFLELYLLTEDAVFLDRYEKCTEYFYNAGGSRFYAIGMPMAESVKIFRRAGRKDQAEKLLRHYLEQGDFILECGKNYPAHEVDYEQSIVAPAAICMCELYALTKEEKYGRAAREQLRLLDLFQGFQPDYHMNEAAIRHWDGYWFGKRKCLGDTYPHYWSALSGYAYAVSGQYGITGDYTEKADRTLRAVLSLFREDGSASCAMVYPMSVNGRAAAFYDPWANDQDWGLYYTLKYGEETQAQAVI